MRAGDIVNWLGRLDKSAAGESEVAWGSLETSVQRLVITWAADVDTLSAVAELPGPSLVLSRSHPFYAPPLGFDSAIVPSREGWNDLIGSDVVAAAKRELLAGHELVLVTATWLWNVLGVDGRSLALAEHLALGTAIGSAGEAVIVELTTASSVSDLSEIVSERLGAAHMLVIGGVDRIVGRIAIVAGVVSPQDLALVLRDPRVGVVVAGEVVEWEAGPYLQDAIAVGRELSLIAVGTAVSENPMSSALAVFLEREGIPIPVSVAPTSQAAWAVRQVVAE